jgi:RelA/SpoT family (p)ppGpp synthetase
MNPAPTPKPYKFPTLDKIWQTLPKPSQASRDRLVLAHNHAVEVHGGKRRDSGELYVEHDRAVAYQSGLISSSSILTTAGMLHDNLAEELLSHDRHKRLRTEQFGADVINLVLGLQELLPYTKLEIDRDPKQLENLRRAILSVSQEHNIGVIVLRMADRLENLRLADRMPPEKMLSIAREAQEIYAPIANRLGIWTLKWQLEDGALRILQPEVYRELQAQIDAQSHERDAEINKLMQTLRVQVAQAGIRAQVLGRPKHIASVYRKMQRKDVGFEEIYDLRAIRVILQEEDVNKCYQVLGIVHNMWEPIAEEFDDYIANPKPNGYRSLHTAVHYHKRDPNKRLEVQIRTQTMDDDAERGIAAAHWIYKEGGKASTEVYNRVQWMRQLLIDLRDDNKNAPAAERLINVDDLTKRIYVFTPQRELVELPEGATPVDFAYKIHSGLGHRCRGAKVNDKMVSLDYELKQGDKVEIIKGSRPAPSRDWMSESAGYAASAGTRAKVRQWFRKHDRESNIIQGRELIERELRRLKLTKLMTVEDLAAEFNEPVDDFLAKLGFGDLQFSQIAGAIERLRKEREPAEAVPISPLPPPPPPPRRAKEYAFKAWQGCITPWRIVAPPSPPNQFWGM